jgi:type IX secretion system PorP/SprF family membrane protein
MQNYLFNPSFAGVFRDADQKGMFGITYRQQWTGISGSPTTINAFGSVRLNKQGIGIGGNFYSDKTGPTSRTGLLINLAKHIRMQDGGVFSLGLESRLQQYRIDVSKIADALPNDPAIAGNKTSFKYDAGFGMSYTNKHWQLGASVSQLIQSKLDTYTGNLTRSTEGRLYRHYYGNASYRWFVDESNVIIPHVLFVYLPNAPMEVNGGVRVEHSKTLWWGIGYRSTQSWMLSAGVNIKQRITLGYNYDFYTSPLSNFDGGSGAHELLVRFQWK